MLLYSEISDTIQDGTVLNKQQTHVCKFIGTLVHLNETLLNILCHTKNRYGFDRCICSCTSGGCFL